MQKLKAITIVIIIILSLIPVYSINKYLQKITRPRESLQRLFLYMLSGMLLIFAYTLLLVLAIKLLFPRS